MNDAELNRQLQSIGKTCFVMFFTDFSNPDQTDGAIARRIARSMGVSYQAALNIRVKLSRKIMRAGRGFDALVLCSQSKGLSTDIREQAADLVKQHLLNSPSRATMPARNTDSRQTSVSNPDLPGSDLFQGVKRVRMLTRQSWSNIAKGTLALQEKTHKEFGTRNVAASSKSTVRRICREVGLAPYELEELLIEAGVDMEAAKG